MPDLQREIEQLREATRLAHEQAQELKQASQEARDLLSAVRKLIHNQFQEHLTGEVARVLSTTMTPEAWAAALDRFAEARGSEMDERVAIRIGRQFRGMKDEIEAEVVAQLKQELADDFRTYLADYFGPEVQRRSGRGDPQSPA